MALRKDQLESTLNEKNKPIEISKLKEDNPLDLSEPFVRLCTAVRRGDLKVCQEAITSGANLNARDLYDYTPLILASLCGHYAVVQLLLESGAICERDTFQGERCLYNALNDRIRDLLLEYDFSKSTDPLQPLAAHITSLLSREHPKTSDIVVISADHSLRLKLHKFVLAARSPYFQHRLSTASEITSWKLPAMFPPHAFEIAIKYIYLGELPSDFGGGPGTAFSEEEVMDGLHKISEMLAIPSLWDDILEIGDRKLARQHKADETERGRAQLETLFQDSVIRHKVVVDSAKADGIKWDRDNALYADVLLRADDDDPLPDETHITLATSGTPIGSLPRATDTSIYSRSSTLFPVHRAMLLRSEYFEAMFSSSFLEAQDTPKLQIIPIDCSPDVLEAVLHFMYTERTDFSLDIAVDVLFAADLLLMERLKAKAALIISTLGNGALPADTTTIGTSPEDTNGHEVTADLATSDPLDPFQILKAAWLLRVPRLEEFAARYLAYRLERYIDLPDFAEAIVESAARIKHRQETDSIELVDDIRHYLSERFRLRFEGDGIEEMLGGNGSTEASGREVLANGIAQDQQANAESGLVTSGGFRTLDGKIAGDEFASDQINYEMLLGKIETLLEKLDLDG